MHDRKYISKKKAKKKAVAGFKKRYSFLEVLNNKGFVIDGNY